MRIILSFLIIIGLYFDVQAQSFSISGNVRDSETREPLPYVNVIISGTSLGASTDDNGNFKIEVKEELSQDKVILVSYVGYKSDAHPLYPIRGSYNFTLQPNLNALNEVVVISGTMKEVTKMNSPIPVEIYTPALFTKNPTPNIFEAMAMVNGVQPQINCNVCNTGDIHINGMEGPYTMVLIDGMPIVSSLATVYGLAGIPNSMVKQIEVVKGPASTLYGSEAVGGLINIITKDPSFSPIIKVDAFATSYGEYNLDLSTKWKLGKTASLLGINYFNFSNRVDANDDNFTDVTLQQRVSLFNKWDFHRSNNRIANLAVRYIYEDRWGGEMQWNSKYRGSNEIYGESIYTNRVELIGNYQLPISNEKIIFDYSYNYHLQDSYYGVYKYLATQQVGFGQLRWDKKVGKHDLLMGMPFRVIHYDDNTPGTANADSTNKPMNTLLPGIFIQDEFAFSPKVTMLTGMRYDHHNIHGAIYSPRVSVKISPSKTQTLRASVGNGFRVVNLFTEDHAALTGSREVVIENKLKPEESWNGNLNYTHQVILKNGFLTLDGSLFYTYFTNKIVGDFLTSDSLIIYDNLKGHAISKGLTLNTELAFNNSLKLIAGVTFMDVFQLHEDATGEITRKQQLFAPKVSGTYSLSYTLSKPNITLDLTGKFNGPMALPVLTNVDDKRPDHSPWYTLLNFQITKSFANGLELYGGLKNILNFTPKDPIYNWQDPSSKNFDTTYNYAPLQGIRGFLGVRYTLY